MIAGHRGVEVQADRVTRWLFGLFGVLGPILFIGVFLWQGATRPNYHPIKTFVSQLSLGDGGWMQIAFVISGLLIAAFGLAMLVTRRPPLWGWIAVSVAGFGLIGAGCFVDDPWLGYPPGPGTPAGIGWPVSPHGWGHLLSAFFIFLGLDGAALFFAWAFAQRQRQCWYAYSVISAIAFPVLYVAALASGVASGDPASPLGGYAGLFQRASLVTGLAWVALLAVHHLSSPQTTDPP